MKIGVRPELLRQRSLIFLVLVFTLGFWTISGAVLWELRRQTWDNAMLAATNLVTAVSQDIGRNIELYDLSLQAVLDGLKLAEINEVSPRTRHAILFDRAATAQYLGSILILDEHGNVVEDAGSLPPRPDNFSDRAYFTAHRDNPNVGLYISEPFRRRLTGSGDWVIAFSRRVNKPDGSFGGVVSSTLRLDYFNVLFSRLKLGPQSAVTLFRTDGTLITRAPFDESILGRRFVNTAITRNLMASQSGEFEAKASLDSVTRAFSFSHVAKLPLVVFVAQSREDILATWTRWACAIVGVLAAMGLAIALLARLARTEFHRRQEAEQGIRRREEELRLMTDHATDVIVRLDASLTRRYVSSASLRVLGRSPDKLVGQNFRDTIHPDDREQAITAIEDGRRRQEPISLSYRILRPDGRLTWVESQFSYMEHDQGLTVLVRDVTQRKSVENDLAEANLQLQRLAATDGLTGLANRRRFDEAMLVEWRRAARDERPLSLLLIDVDHFKQFNDRYGHQEGDTCLQVIATALAGCARRPADLVARYGGEEFVVLLPDTHSISAQEVGERVRQKVEDQAIPHVANLGHNARVTISVGCHTTYPQSLSAQDAKKAIDRFVASCDRALYAAKSAGRNKVSNAEQDEQCHPVSIKRQFDKAAL